MNADKGTARSLADLVRIVEDTRAWSKTLRADSVRVKRQVAQTEEALAATLARLARRQPHHAYRLQTQSAEAANHAVQVRRRAADRSQRRLPGSERLMGEAADEHPGHQRRHAAAHEHAAGVHDQAARMHQGAAEFFEEHDEPGKADCERDLADRNAQAAETDRRAAATDIEELPPDS